ncbi:TlpA family protein disulfide reductase [Granulicella sibirica]|uniref:Thioredoxin family protein n=1 Tax=Granulicella sibirica TaxID=2479048 RepID=A0A4Q0T1D2_9BACT|nr:TlpA family protein disulfide reductase [Granulicella sibirica]RXH55699.1 Thioredoxin family protein [Granulicella sibirica]
MKRGLSVGAVFLLAVMSLAQDHPAPADVKTTPDRITPIPERKPAADFSLPDAQGNTITLSGLKGKVVLLDFWATWCGGCKLEIPWYMEFDKKYRDMGLSVIGVSMDDEGMKVVKPFLAQRHIDYPVVIGDEAMGKRFGLGQMPLTLLIDKQGRVAIAHSGVVDKDDFESHIRELLQ